MLLALAIAASATAQTGPEVVLQVGNEARSRADQDLYNRRHPTCGFGRSRPAAGARAAWHVDALLSFEVEGQLISRQVQGWCTLMEVVWAPSFPTHRTALARAAVRFAPVRVELGPEVSVTLGLRLGWGATHTTDVSWDLDDDSASQWRPAMHAGVSGRLQLPRRLTIHVDAGWDAWHEAYDYGQYGSIEQRTVVFAGVGWMPPVGGA